MVWVWARAPPQENTHHKAMLLWLTFYVQLWVLDMFLNIFYTCKDGDVPCAKRVWAPHRWKVHNVKTNPLFFCLVLICVFVSHLPGFLYLLANNLLDGGCVHPRWVEQ